MKWGRRITLAEKARGKALTFEQRAALANCLENMQGRIKAMEATNSGNIGQFKRYALDLITSVVPNLIAFDVVGVQAMDTRISMINYIDYNYSKAKGQTEAGQTFASSINMLRSDENYSSDLVDLEVVGQGDGSKTTFTATLPWTPVLPTTFTLEAGNVIASADAAGTITGTGVSGTITPAGALSLTFATAPASGTDILVSYRFNNEDVRSDGPEAAGFTNVPEVELKLHSLPVTAHARTMRAFWSFDALENVA